MNFINFCIYYYNVKINQINVVLFSAYQEYGKVSGCAKAARAS